MAVTEVKNYQAFRGVDYSASPAVISEDHASDILNMYIGSDGVMQKRPGWHILNTFWKNAVGQHIYGIHYVQYREGMGMLFVHAGTSLYGTIILHNADGLGDVNGDGDITAADAVMILQALAGTRVLKPEELYRADVNGDGRVTREDAVSILRIVVGREPKPDESDACKKLSGSTYISSFFKVQDRNNNDLVLAPHRSVSFEHDKNLYILDGEHYIRLVPTYATTSYTVSGETISLPYIDSVKAETVEGYIPTTGANGHYEYAEMKTEVVEGAEVVNRETKTIGNGQSSAEFTAQTSFVSRIVVTLIVNDAMICNGLVKPTKKDANNKPYVNIGYYNLLNDNGKVTVTSNWAARALGEGDKVTLHIKLEDEENVISGEPGTESNPGTWIAPTLDEERNLIQTKQINTFSADGIHRAYYLRENNCDVTKVEMYQWTRCKSINGVDTPTQENIDHVDAGTYNGIYYYYTYVWTEINEQSLFTEFSGSTAYDEGDLVKRTVGTDVTYYECTVHHYGAWNADHFAETYSYSARNASSSTPVQNEISYSTRILFNDAIPAGKDGMVNVRVTFAPRKHSSTWAVNKDRGYIEKATIVTRFGYFNDNRYFFAGNPEHKNMDLMSAVDDPTYIPNTGWTMVGSKLTAIMGYLHYGSELAIIKEDNEQDATVYMRSAVLTEDNNVIFPVQQGAQGMGAISQYAFGTLRDDPLFLAKEGVYAIQGTDASQERNIPNRSFFVDPVLKKEISAMFHAAVWGDYYVLCNPSTGRCYVADARYMGLPPGTNNRSHGYEWYVWDNVPAECFCVVGDRLFFGTADGRLCVFNSDWDNPKRYSDGAEFVDGSTVLHKWNPYDGGYPIHAYYVTKRDHLGALDFKKTMLNDGGVITLQPYERSSAAITVKTDKGEWFVEQIHTDSDEPSMVIPIRHRFKWFDSIETRIENNEMDEGLAILGVQYRYAITTNRR